MIPLLPPVVRLVIHEHETLRVPPKRTSPARSTTRAVEVHFSTGDWFRVHVERLTITVHTS